MLLRPGPIPRGDGWTFELKYDGFRAIVSTESDLRVRSHRGWNMTTHVPELRELPAGLVLDGELVAFNEAGAPHWATHVRTGAARQPLDPRDLRRVRPAVCRWARRDVQPVAATAERCSTAWGSSGPGFACRMCSMTGRRERGIEVR